MAGREPLVSVIIPMYNAVNTIEDCLNSVLEQTYQHLEIIVINDGSKDHSAKLVEETINKRGLNNLTLINKPNGGVSSARNAGLKAFRGEFAAFLDSDDTWHPNKIKRQLAVFEENPAADMLGCIINNIPLKRFFFKKFSALTEIRLKDQIFKNFFQPSTVIAKRTVIETIGYFDESQRYAEEGNYFIRVCSKFKCFLMNENLIEYGAGKAGFGESGLSSNIKEMEKGELKNLRYAYKHRHIGFATYLIAVSLSLIKYMRRVVIIKLK